jgi:predicted PurR-regulated permease PerM
METRPAASASSPATLPGPLRPEHLYKFGALLFMLALAYRFFDVLSRVFLLVYAAAILAVALNGIVRRLPMKRRWTAALIGLFTVAGFAAAVWFGGSALLRQLRGLADSFPAMEAQLRAWADELRERVVVDVELVSERTGQMARNFFADLSGSEMLGRAGGAAGVGHHPPC